ncbi:MAG: hypothetical protein A3A12_01330 [Candidatus Staskawiczbacteria bacterium RIFCSPLOWO2_01_FULL_43_17b]|nr:MAG: hypothetical protein A3A12_01330 [Candidatus Staskawiczbacteria bacterium RIFCSPLOWO2_01_FULL_43_17b]
MEWEGFVMFKMPWKTWLLVATHLAAVVIVGGLMQWHANRQPPRVQYLLVYAQQPQVNSSPQENLGSWALVILPQGLLCDDEIQNLVTAKSRLDNQHWQYVGVEPTKRVPRTFLPPEFRDFPEGKVFVFKSIPGEKAPVAQ